MTFFRLRGLARLGAALAVASALTIAMTAAPASAATNVSDPILANGTYRWQEANSGLCLAYDVEARGASRQEACDGDDYTKNWDVVNTSGNTYEFINEHNGQCLTIPDNSTSNGASPFVYTCGGGGAQFFTLVPATSASFPGAYQIVNTNSGKCVNVGGDQRNLGAWIVQYDCSQRGDEMWRPI